MLLRVIIVLLILPACFMCRQAQAQFPAIEVSIQSDSVDVCGTGTRSLIIVDVQNISIQDSIFGYDIEIRYNPDKLYLSDEIFSGTLTEKFADHKLTFPEPGIARGWAASFSRPVATSQNNQPLIAMAGKYLGGCNDTVQLHISAISFAHVQNDEVVDIDGKVGTEGVVVGYIADKPERRVEVTSDRSSVELEGIQVAEPLTLRLQNGPGRGIDTLELELQITNSQQFGIDSIEPVSDDVVILESHEEEVGQWLVTLALPSVWKADSLIRIKMESRANKNDTGTVVVRPVHVNACACVSGLRGSSIELHSTEKIEVDVADMPRNNQQVFVQDSGNEWMIWSEEEALGSVRVINLLGQEIIKIEKPHQASAIIDKSQLPRGLYLIQIGRDQHRQMILITR